MTTTTTSTISSSSVGTSVATSGASTFSPKEEKQLDQWKQIMNFIAEHQDIFIKAGIGIGGLLLGMLLMCIVFKLKGSKKSEKSTKNNNGVANMGRTSTEMDTLLRQYISDTKTRNQQWQNATSGAYYPEQQMSSAVHDVIPMPQIHDAQYSYNESTTNGSTINAPAFEYTNSALAQEYMDMDTHGVTQDAPKGENYFLLEKNFIETNENLNVPGLGVSDNYFLVDKDYIGAGSQDQSQISEL